MLTRQEFREAVLARDGGCVFCDKPAVDAHHILERRLWPDGGYHLDNGVAVCSDHHMECEKTLISVEDVRLACGVKTVVPPHLYADQAYDKWGNPILENGMRLRGELFFDESVQKVLSEVLHLFVHWVKYPRTHHLPWSEGINSDDRIIPSLDGLQGDVVVTEKMDGENTTMYRDYIHARSVDGRSHPSRSWVKQFWSTICADIPEGWRICGENMYAQHSIAYDALPSYFLGFSIWNEHNVCLPWDETLEWFELLGITPVPVIYRGVFSDSIRDIKNEWGTCEGYVIRSTGPIAYGEFKHKIAKFVRAGHIQTIKHWMYGQPIIPNKLRS
jgi:hypothetical protein